MNEEEELFDRAVNAPLDRKIERAVGLLKFYEQSALKLSNLGYYLAFSGGKDSVVIKELAKIAGVKFDSHFNVTTIDPPEVINFIREKHPEVIWENRNKYKCGFFSMVVRWGLPTSTARWCCRIFKEGGGEDRLRIVGIRALESSRRKRLWKEFQSRQGSQFLAPICYWTEEDVWKFIKSRNLPYCSLYDEGFDRVGCIGCPLQSRNKLNENFRRFPKWENAYKIAAKRYFEKRQERIKAGTYRGKIDPEKAVKTWQEYWELWRFQKNRRDFKLCVFEEMRREFPT